MAARQSGNQSVGEIPEYLRPYVVEQDSSLYTAIDHASWRFILKIAQFYFAKHAHQKYLDGLRETGISTERIPQIGEMDICLRKFGWRCVGVSGFIPPAVFMEYLSLGILPIACDMRKLENLSYTPAPDIVHEAAGHAPIIADPQYAEYLKAYGEISQKAIYSEQDLQVYEAIRSLSDIKEDPASNPEQVEKAQTRLDAAVASVDEITEATQLARMSWWTIEYGLVGPMNNPKIYGAGLLSSVGESYKCLEPSVRKIPFTLKCIEQTYDITRPQPQLYVAKDFAALTAVLKEFGETLAFRRGGIEGLTKAKKAHVPTTSVFDSGVQVSGVLADFLVNPDGSPAYLKFTGPCQVCHHDRELEGQGAAYHSGGFGTPVGKIRGIGKSPAELSGEVLARLGFKEGSGQAGKLEFESGVVVEGKLAQSVRKDGRNLLLIFENCTVRKGAELLFKPEWGRFDMSCGGAIVSVFGGAADRASYLRATGGFKQVPGKPKSNLTAETRDLNALYAKVREIRDGKAGSGESGSVHAAGGHGANLHAASDLAAIHLELERKFPEDWLLRYELLELDVKLKLHAPWSESIRRRLKEIAAHSAEKADLISRGLELL